MGERGSRRAERANEYLSKTGRERIRRLREELQQANECPREASASNAPLVRTERRGVSVLRLRRARLRLGPTRQATLQPNQVLADACEAPLVLDLQFLNLIPQFPVAIAIWAHGSSYMKSARQPRVGKTLPRYITARTALVAPVSRPALPPPHSN